MEKLEIAATKFVPHIILDKDSGKFSISGKSISENPYMFFRPVLDWIIEYLKNPNKITVIEFFMDYFNTSTSKTFSDLLDILEKAESNGTEIKIIWYYEPGDDELKDVGKELLEQVSIPYSIVKKNRP